MNRDAKSIFVFGVYLTLLGGGLILVPDDLLARFGLPPMSAATGLVLGTVIIILGYLCLWAARTGWNSFFHWSVHSRCGVMVTFGTFVLLRLAPPGLLLFGVLDLLGAIWTAYALRPVRDRHAFAIGCHGTGIV